jgi:mannose-6-phosphate isomerase-like protein (cupin superfamily)
MPPDYLEPAGEEKAGWRRPDGIPYFRRYATPWETFLDEEGLPVYKGVGVHDSRELPRADWPRVGGKGSYIQLIGTNNDTGMFVVEVAPRSSLKPQKHLYEERYVAIEGSGIVEVWKDGSSVKSTFEFQPWTIFSIPLNAWFRIENQSSGPGVLVAANSAPRMMNLFDNQEFIFNSSFTFDDRFGGNLEDYWKPNLEYEPQPVRGRAMVTTNLIPDASRIHLPLDNNRGPGHRWLAPNMTGNRVLQGWIAEYPSGRYAKAHAHAAGAVLVCLGGKGYSITWPKDEGGMTPWQEGKGELVKMQDYVPGGMISAAPGPANWYHQHFAYGQDGMRFFLITGPVPGAEGERSDRSEEREGSRIQVSLADVTQGGSAIPYHMEDPHIRATFDQRLKDEGAKSTMPPEVYDESGSQIHVMDV